MNNNHSNNKIAFLSPEKEKKRKEKEKEKEKEKSKNREKAFIHPSVDPTTTTTLRNSEKVGLSYSTIQYINLPQLKLSPAQPKKRIEIQIQIQIQTRK